MDSPAADARADRPPFGVPVTEQTVLRDLAVGQPFLLRYWGVSVQARIVKVRRSSVVLAVDAPPGFEGRALPLFGRPAPGAVPPMA